MKKFLVCNPKIRSWKQSNQKVGDEHVIIYCKDLKTVFEAWSQMGAAVKKVTINVFTEDPKFTINPYFLNLAINTTIKDIEFNCYTDDVWLRFILDTCPNLETLYFFKLTKDKVKYAAENFEHLKHLYCDYMEEDTEEFYKQLKATNKDLNCEIKIN